MTSSSFDLKGAYTFEDGHVQIVGVLFYLFLGDDCVIIVLCSECKEDQSV